MVSGLMKARHCAAIAERSDARLAAEFTCADS